MKKGILALAITSTALLAGCGNKTVIKINPDKEKYLVGVCQLVQHEALDAATNGFKDKLTSELQNRGRSVEILVGNASGENALCQTIVSNYVAQDVDLIMANATAALQTAFNATTTIPVLGTSITDYTTAIGLPMKDGISGTNLSGTSDIASIEDQINIMLQLLPNAKKVGILYCSGEPNSKFQVNEAKKFLEAKNITVNEYSFSETIDLAAALNNARNNDAVYIPTDNTCANNGAQIKSALTDNGVPVFAGEAGICKKCGFATLSIDYYRLGEVTGKMAAEILTGEKEIDKYAIQYDGNPVKMYNKEVCESLGITVPSDFVEVK